MGDEPAGNELEVIHGILLSMAIIAHRLEEIGSEHQWYKTTRTKIICR